jgi:methionine sulfoxide reductase heme-binding subunit
VSTVLAVTTGSPLWYFARATGMVALVLLTVTVVLGIVTSVRWTSPRWPRFVVEYVHRDVTLLVMAFIALHVATVVLDGFAPIGWLAAVVPFSSPYRPLWLGLGAVAFDLLLAIGITSWLRHRIGFRVWRFVHWFAYGAWAFSVVHGLATGTDTQQGWALLVNAACTAAVVAAVWWRLAVGWERANAGLRTAILGATFVLPLALVGWLRTGPLATAWARRSGTPASVLTKTQTRATPTTPPTTTTTPSSRSEDHAGSDDDGGFFDR